MSGIVVITHNGKMPREGGKRLGYVSGGVFMPSWLPGKTFPVSAIRRLLPGFFPPLPSIVLADLPQSSYPDECPHCYTTITDVQQVETLQGLLTLGRCRRCREYFRPYASQVHHLAASRPW